MKNNDFLKLVNPFWGNAGTASPAAVGMARNWNWLKAQTGNTHPGALVPCGWVSVVPYSGAYSSGYGINGVSSCGPAPVALERKYAWGFSHFHTSGVGYIGYFYNYFLVTPVARGKSAEQRSCLDNEVATPGYFSGTLTDYGVDFELTAGKYAAFHRCNFTAANSGKVCLDVELLGLDRDIVGERKKEHIEQFEIIPCGENRWHGSVFANGVRIFFAVAFAGNITSANVEGGKITVSVDGRNVDSVMAFSMVDIDEADKRLAEAVSTGFDAARTAAAEEWQKRLSTVRAEFADASAGEVFYSALYHSLVKPADTGKRFIDFQTMWDVYRTQLPLVLAICPDIAKKMLDSMLDTIEEFGFFPNGYLMTDDYHHDDNQATALIVYTLCDGFNRGYITDYSRLKKALMTEFGHADISQRSPTHKLDIAGALRAAAEVAAKAGDAEYAAQLREESKIWKKAYDPATGLLVEDAVYYEGNHWNYSFRPHTDMSERVALAGGVENFGNLLDKFFGADCPPENAPEERGMIIGRFEGMNNESDMETPYCYLWAGRSDRLAEVCDLVRRCRFCCGDGGCPGNNDSGGLSSWYVWSELGIYPYTGTGYYLLGSPSVERAEIDLPQGTLEITVERESSGSIYPAGYELNGREFAEPWIALDILEKGGKLKFRLADKPAGRSPIPEWL